MLVSPKKSGKIYSAYSIVTLLCLAFFFSSPYLFADGYISRSVNYDVICSHNDYDVKISGAYYSDGICAFTFKCRATKETTQSFPEIQKVTFDNLSSEYAFETGDFIDDYTRIITVSDVPTEFEVMKITVYSEEEDTVYDDSYNEFGELVEGYTEEGTTYVMTITIDKNDMSSTVTEPETAQIYADEDNDLSASNSFSSDNSFDTDSADAVQSDESIRTSDIYTSDNESQETESEEISSETTISTEQITTQNSQNNTSAGYSGGSDGGGGGSSENIAQTQKTTVQTTVTTTSQTVASTAKTTAKSSETSTTASASSDQTATKLSITGGDITLGAGETAALTVNTEPQGAKTTLVWTSNKPDIAAVNAGKVTAVTAGKAIITVTDKVSGLTASCMITVNG